MIEWDYLRHYQRRLVNETRQSLAAGNRSVILQSATGSGKTLTALYMIQEAAKRGNNSMFIVRRRELMRQTASVFRENRITTGVVAAGRAATMADVQVAMVKTLANRLEKGLPVRMPKLVFIDEAHLSLAPTYKYVIDRLPKSTRIIGLTATPTRGDDVALGEMYEDMVLGPPVRDLINEGSLCDYEFYAPPVGMEFDGRNLDKQSADKLDKAVVGKAVDHYLKITPGKKCVVMCPNVAHAKNVAQQYNERGISAACIDGTMSDAQREKILDNFANGNLLVVTSCNLLIEGVDIPSIEVVQWLRATESVVVWLQGIGRALRIFEGKRVAYILDHVRNYKRLGFPCDVREWSLDGPETKERQNHDEVKVMESTDCVSCYKTYRGKLPVCPYCGHLNQELKERKILELDGELKKMEIERVAARRKEVRRKQGQARTLEEHVKIFANEGGKNPSARAVFVYAAKQKRDPEPDDFKEARRVLAEIQKQEARRSLL